MSTSRQSSVSGEKELGDLVSGKHKRDGNSQPAAEEGQGPTSPRKDEIGMGEGRLFKKPAGPAGRHWCNMMLGTSSGVLCQACGSEHPEDVSGDETLNLSRVLGLQIVDQCCGRAIDILFEEWGEEFFAAFLEEWTKSPGDWKFLHVLDRIEEALAKVKVKAMRTLELTSSNQDEIEKLRVFQKAVEKWVRK